jgi:hypothetical protein
VLAALAAIGFSGAAFAEQVTKGSSPATMTDSEMDRVTAGARGGDQGPNLDNFGQFTVRPAVSHGAGGW